LIVSLLIVAAWVVSIPWEFACVRYNVGMFSAFEVVGVEAGRFVFRRAPSSRHAGPGATISFGIRRASQPTVYWRLVRVVYAGGNLWNIMVPFWIPFVFVAMPTALLWWLDRRSIPPDQCRKCGYNLTGNVSGRCPECGTTIRIAEDHSEPRP
jgi:hypothetical protein